MAGEICDGKLFWVANVDGACDGSGRVHEAADDFDEIVHIAKGAGLLTVSVDSDRFIFEGLHDKIGNDPAVFRMHAGAVGVEDSSDLDGDVVLAVVVEEEGFGAPFSFVVARANTDRINITPIGFLLGVDVGISVDLARGSLKNFDL